MSSAPSDISYSFVTPTLMCDTQLRLKITEAHFPVESLLFLHPYVLS